MMKLRRWILFLILFSCSVLVVNQYLFCPQYSFVKQAPFSGSKFYNPYEGLDSLHWRKCNFHAHVSAWFGITNGKGDPAAAWNTYESLGYDVHCISNYHSISDYKSSDANYIEAYEHGMGLFKNHQNVIGSKTIVWADYLLPQTRSNKQRILSRLPDSDSTIITINHPETRHAYLPQDMSFLSGYDCIEIFPSGSMPQWDSALSAGKAIFAVANDDVHDITNPDLVALNCTWVNVEEVNKKNIIRALKAGKSFAMVTGTPKGESLEKKIERAKEGYAKLRSVEIVNDTLTITVTDTGYFQIIGQSGKRLSTQEAVKTATYIIQPDDTYLRTRIFFANGNEIDLNPILRYNGKLPDDPLPPVNKIKTFFLRLTGSVILLILGALPFIKIRSRKNQQS